MDIKKYLKVIKCIMVNKIKSDTSFRANFILNVLQEVIQIIILILFFDVIYSNNSKIGNWSFSDSLLLISTNQFINALYSFLFTGVGSIPDYVGSGKLDTMLLKPISARFLISMNSINFDAILTAILALPLFAYVLSTKTIKFTLINILLYLIFILIGVAIKYFFAFSLMSLSFWMVKAYALQSIFAEFFNLTVYPESIYKGIIRILFSIVIPIMIIANLPTMVLMGYINFSYIIYSLTAFIIFWLLSCIVWKEGLKYYTSASS